MRVSSEGEQRDSEAGSREVSLSVGWSTLEQRTRVGC